MKPSGRSVTSVWSDGRSEKQREASSGSISAGTWPQASPLWDALVFPIRELSDVGELHSINVVRFSPKDSTRISDAGADKLQGVSWFHFGTFLDRPSRENDYLRGRLDTAERLIDLLGEADDAVVQSAFAAILDEEKKGLAHIQNTIKDVSRKVPASR